MGRNRSTWEVRGFSVTVIVRDMDDRSGDWDERQKLRSTTTPGPYLVFYDVIVFTYLYTSLDIRKQDTVGHITA